MGTRRVRILVIAALVSLVAAACGASVPSGGTGGALRAEPVRADVDPALASVGGGDVGVIVQARPGALEHAVAAALDAGARVTRRLPIVNGFAATVTGSALDRLAGTPSIAAVSLDRPVRVHGTTASSSEKSVYTKVLRADDMWAAGATGRGVTVALIDTGIADVVDVRDRVLPVYDDVEGTWSPCVNLSEESHCGDSFGHGTFMAGIIAGNGAASNGAYKGVAPEANLVSIKLSGASGAADVSSLLAAIQWTVSFKDRYGIRVLNLSLGTDGTGSYKSDPLNYAVQRAWAEGIVVVVAAGNLGPDAGTVSKPGDDPWVITVGAVDDRATSGLGDDTVPNFTGRGPTRADGLAKPDLVAPGAKLISLRAPGSTLDGIPSSLSNTAYRRGSGTSMATAAVSGSVALMLQADPSRAPDRVKYALTSTARGAASTDRLEVGAGVADVYRATFSAPAGVANQGLERSSGLGSLDATRGTVRVQADDPLVTLVDGLLTAQLLLWDPVEYTTGEWSGSKWYGSKWYGSKWYGSKWYGSKWYGSKWYGSKWYGEGADGDYGTPSEGGAWLGAWQ